jgi:glutamate N-acetyltransferase / amino-acid N-acetyltransferase
MSTFHIAVDPKITSPKGFRAAGIHAGLKKQKLDLGVVVCDVPANGAAVYTTNAFQAAPLLVTMSSLDQEGKLQAIVVNSGNANSCTGQRGISDAETTRQKASELLGISPHLVGVASTGVIGEYLDMECLLSGLPQLIDQASLEGEDSFARAILTTDTCTKKVEVHVEVEGQIVKIAGVAKGSGMIHPNMATMLGFITTDAVIPTPCLQFLLKQAVDETFNMITVDGDCSTNDMVVAMASGLVKHEPLTLNHPDWPAVSEAFTYVCRELAKMIARDGEGATRLIEVQVEGAPSLELAKRVAKSIVGSNLCKTAVFGTDANWGRIICAIGYGAPELFPDIVDAYIGETQVVQNGLPIDFDEEKVVRSLLEETVLVRVDLHSGSYRTVAWGCDLTYDYVKINASYRT